jgi:hypothetical protein
MAETTLLIGGHGLHLTGGYTLPRVMAIPGMSVFASPGAKTDMEIRLDASFTASPSPQWLHEFVIADGDVRCRFGIDGDGTYWQAFGNHGVLRYREGEGVDVSPLRDFSSLRFALWTAYALMGVKLGAVPVHSSVVVAPTSDGTGEKAVMCLGESGTGKSTHTRLWRENIAGARLLNDDSPILSIIDGEVRVYGSPWGGKTDCFLQESHPVAGLLRLEQRKENTIRRLGIVQAFTALQPSCPPVLAREEHCLDLLTDYISQILERTPVYRMGCLPDADAAFLSHKTLFQP